MHARLQYAMNLFVIINHAGGSRAGGMVISRVCNSVCVCVRVFTLKEKRLEL